MRKIKKKEYEDDDNLLNTNENEEMVDDSDDGYEADIYDEILEEFSAEEDSPEARKKKLKKEFYVKRSRSKR